MSGRPRHRHDRAARWTSARHRRTEGRPRGDLLNGNQSVSSFLLETRDESLSKVSAHAMRELEGRVVPSAMAAHTAALAAELRPVKLPAAEIAQSNASDAAFGLNTSNTIHAGLPVAEQLTIKYNDGSTQTESLLRIPNTANNTVTSSETINLRNNGGTETVVDTETFSGGTTPFSGNNRTHTITTTLPNGSTETETEHVLITGDKTVINATINEANGGVETWTTTKIKNGRTTTAHKTIIEPDGTVEHQTIITTNRGDLDSTTTTKTVVPSKDEILFSSSATNVARVQPPSSS